MGFLQNVKLAIHVEQLPTTGHIQFRIVFLGDGEVVRVECAQQLPPEFLSACLLALNDTIRQHMRSTDLPSRALIDVMARERPS